MKNLLISLALLASLARVSHSQSSPQAPATWWAAISFDARPYIPTSTCTPPGFWLRTTDNTLFMCIGTNQQNGVWTPTNNVVASASVASSTSDISSTPLYSVPALVSGQTTPNNFRVCGGLSLVALNGATSSTLYLGTLEVSYTQQGNSAVMAVGANSCATIIPDPGTQISYLTTGYSSSGGTASFALKIRIENIGN